MALSLDEALGMSLADEADESIHVNVNTRQITIPESQQLFGVESDADVEVKHIVIDGRYNDGTDLSDFTFRVNYQNANGNKGTYLATELQVNDSSIEFDWVIGRKVVAYKGTIAFIVCAYTIDSSSVIQNEWNSTLGKGTVLEGLEVSEFDFGDDIVRQLASILSDVNTAQASAKDSADEAYKSKTEVVALGKEQQAAIEKKGKDTLATIPEDYTKVSNDVSQLKEDFVKKIDKPSVADEGKTPRAKNGNVEWVEQGLPSDSQTETAVTNWLNDHPEATTTVQDGSITDIKIEESLLNRINQSYNPMLINIKSNVNVGQTPFLDGHTYDLCGHTITIKKAIGNNLSFRNGKIVLPSEYRFTDVHGSFVLENIVIESDFWSAHNIYCDDIRITNCKFTNIAFGFPDSKQVYINNNRFICTVDNSASTVGSEEFIHINPSTPLDVCVISNNYFYGSQNDCIDCFPAGFVTKIIGNTFDECSDTIIELKSHYRDQGHPNGNTEQSVDGIIISENVFKNVKRRTADTVCINIYATDERTGIVDKDFSFYPKVTISDCIFDNSNNEKVVCIRIAAEGGVVLVSNCRTFAKNSQDDDDANGVFVKGESSCTVYISNCYTTTKNFLAKGTSTVGVMTARVSNCYGRYITDFVDNIYMNNTKIHRIFSKKGNMRILTNCELTDNYTPNSDSVLIGCFVKNIFSPSVTDGINVKITNSFYTGSISSSSLIESVGNVKIV